jgi:chemotaxis signal transduction protein
MKKAKSKKSKLKSDSILSTGKQPELKNLISNIENEIETAQLKTLDSDSDIDEGQDWIDIGRHICIELADKQFAIPLTAVMEAGEHLLVQPLPLLPDWISGITNIRGEIISVVDLNLFFKTKSKAKPTTLAPVETKPYLIVHNDDMKIAMIVDRIIATRPLYSLITKKLKKSQKTDMLSNHFSGEAFYERENVQEEIFLFDLDKFLSSRGLHDFSIA